MAEHAVGLVVSNLVRLQNEEPILLKHSSSEIKSLIDEFEQLECFLKYAEAKQGRDYRVRNWVGEVVRVAHDADDIIENLLLRIEKNREWFPETIERIVVALQNGEIYFYRIIKKITALRNKVHDIVASIRTYGLQPIGDLGFDHAHLREYLPRRFRDNDAVGLEADTAELVGQLVNDDSPLLSVLSITGMGGIGKTTLAQCVYNHEVVADGFDFRGWVSVSQNFNPKRVLSELLAELIPHEQAVTVSDVESLGVPDLLKAIIYQRLQQVRYLVVLDDVWSQRDWDYLIGAFPDMGNGSRLVLTTRSNQVACHAGGNTTHPIRKELLSFEYSWRLFQDKVFSIHGSDPELLDIGKDICSQCCGLPLLIVSMGSILSGKCSAREWRRLLSSMTPLGPLGQVDHLSTILSLSYRDLAPEVKSCFLCLGFFPTTTTRDICINKLLHIWVAHGLVPNKSKAESYVEELADKNLVQVVKASIDGKPRSCRLHPSISEFCILKAREEMFLRVQSTSSYDQDRPSTKTRHLVILSSSSDSNYLHPQTPTPSLRSLLFFLPRGTSISNQQLLLICHHFPLLRVLDLEGLVIGDQLHKRVKQLRNLRYLNLRNTSLTSLHQSIRYLQRLLVLDLRGNNRVEGLNVVQEMKNLEYVYLGKDRERGDFDQALKYDRLLQLRSIGWVAQHELLENDMAKLMSLQEFKLKVSQSDGQVMGRTWDAMCASTQLESLHLQGGSSNDAIILEGNARFPTNIKRLTLSRVKISSLLMEALSQLPELTLLSLKESSVQGECLRLSANGFSLLRYLQLSQLDNLIEFSIQGNNTMPKLQRLVISRCNALPALPVSIQSLNTLEELVIDAMPNHFVSLLQGDDSYKVQNITSVRFT